MVPRLWVPEIHSLWARNWNLAAAGAPFTASSVAKRVVVSTPLRVGSLSVAVMVLLLRWVWWWCGERWCDETFGSGRLELDLAGHGPGVQQDGLGIHGPAQLLLQLDELGHGRVRRERARDLEDLAQRMVALPLVAAQRDVLADFVAQHAVEGDGEQLGVAVGVGHAVPGDGVAMVAGVA